MRIFSSNNWGDLKVLVLIKRAGISYPGLGGLGFPWGDWDGNGFGG